MKPLTNKHRLIITCATALLLQACEQPQAPVESLEVAAKGMHAAALNDNGSLAVVGSIHHGGSMWRLGTKERVFNWNHSSETLSTLVAADFSRDSNWALTAEPATLVLWDVHSGEGIRYWTAPGEILDVELGPGANSALLGLSDHSAVLFDIRRGGIKQTFKHSNRVRSVDLSADGKLALTGSEDYSATLWDTSSGAAITRIKHDNEVQLVKLSNDGSIALSVSKYDKALLWQARSGEFIAEVPLRAQHLKRGLSFTTAAFSENNEYLLTGRPDQIVQLWKLPEAVEIERWKLPKRDKWKPTGAAVAAVAFNEQEGEIFAVASNGFIHLLKRR